MKRYLALILALAVMLCLCACGGNENIDVTKDSGGEVTDPTTEPTDVDVDTVEPTYIVTVIDQNGTPVAGAWVQLCLEACVPAMTDENGVANFFLEENDYKVGFTVMPAGYEYSGEEQEWHFADGENTMTIVLNKVG